LREVTILFADIRGFTALAEDYGHDAEGLTRISSIVPSPK